MSILRMTTLRHDFGRTCAAATTAHATAFAPRAASKAARAFVAIALALGTCLAACAQVASPARAFASEDPYTYTVRVYSGAQGTFAGGADCYTFPPLNAGAQVDFHQGDVKLNDDSKYYVRGWKLAGQDNDTATLFSSLPVNSDMDLVVCYGILGDNVGYTVRYVDAAGNELLPTESFYGNVGESPVLAYRYVEGYLPQAYNLTGELYADAAQNVYTFTYNPVAVPEDVTVVTPTVVTPAAGAAAPAAAEGAGAPAAEGAPAVAVENQGEEAIADDGTPLAEPAEIENIRDDETPLASANSLARSDVLNEGAEMLFTPTVPVVILGVAFVIAVAITVFALLMYRKKQRRMATEAARASIASRYAGGVGANEAYAQQHQQQYQPQYGNTQYYGSAGQQMAQPGFDTQYGNGFNDPD